MIDNDDLEPKQMSRIISTASMSTVKVNLLKALDHAINEFDGGDISESENTRVIMILTSQFDLP